MFVTPVLGEARAFLTLRHRKMIKEAGKTIFKNLKTPMYRESTLMGNPALASYQGLWKSLQKHLEGCGYSVEVLDRRQKILPAPNFQAAMRGLKDPQKPWIMKALLTGDSGLIGAPTRYGKSYGMNAIINAFHNSRIVVTAPGVDLCRQLYNHFKSTLPCRDIRGVYSRGPHRVQGPDVTVCSIDSLHKMDHGDTDILIIDEPHAAVSDTRLPKLAAFERARKYGFGATLNGRFDKKDRLIEALIGPVISNVTYREAVKDDMISPLKVLMVKIPFSKDTLPGNPRRETVYKRLLSQSSRTAALVKRIIENTIPNDWQVMAFIMDEKQADYYCDVAFPPTGTIAMAKKLKDKERKELTDGIAAGDYLRVLASNIYVQGVTFPDLKVVINLAGGGANTTAIQKPGRLLQTRPGKNYGVMIDFLFECKDKDQETRQNPPYSGIVGECWARHKAYTDIGYDVEFVENEDHCRDVILGAYDQ